MVEKENVGGLCVFVEDQRKSCLHMIESFKKYNPTQSIVILSHGFVSEFDHICKHYGCKLIGYPTNIGKPFSVDIEVPLKYLFSFLHASLLIEERYFINIEPDCLVTGEILVSKSINELILSNTTVDWMYYFFNDSNKRNYILPRMIEYYKKYNVYHEPLFDKIVGGGGHLYNKKLAKMILTDWDSFVGRSYEIKKIYDVVDGVGELGWAQDYILSLQIPFYGISNLAGSGSIDEWEHTDKITHPYKKFYV